MTKGSSPADRSLLLDYVSPFLPTVLTRSFKNGDYLVALATTSALLIKLLIVISTGLLTLDTVMVAQHGIGFTASNTFSNTATGLADIGSMPLYTVEGVQGLDLSYPLGTTRQYAFQNFNSSNAVNATALEAIVDGFLADLDCEEALLTVNEWMEIDLYNTPSSIPPQSEQNLSISTPSCQIPYKSMPISQTVKNSKKSYGQIGSGTCTNMSGDNSYRILVLAGVYLEGATVTEGNVSDPTGYETETNFTSLRSMQLVCRPTYAISKVSVLLNSTGGSFVAPNVDVSKIADATNRTLSNVHPWSIAAAVFASADAYNTVPLSYDTYGLDYVDTNFAFGLHQRPDLTLEDLLDPHILKDIAVRFYQLFSAQVVKRALLEDMDMDILGTAYVNEFRLIVRELSVRLMEGILALLSAFALIMMILVPRNGVLPRDPGSIAGLATTLSRSVELYESLANTGTARLSLLRRTLSHRQYHTQIIENKDGLSFEIRQSDRTVAKADQALKQSTSGGPFKWYRPFAITIYARALASVVVVAVIVALEVVLRLSQRNDGLADVSAGGYVHFVWAYIPALAMVSIELLYASLDFSTKVFAPYSKLKVSATFHNSLSVNFLDSMAISTLWQSIGTQHWAVSATTLALVLSSYLTIVVSGLYSTTNIPLVGTISLRRQDSFNSSAAEYYMGGSAPVISGLIVEGNMSYPAWTYGDLALPKVGTTTADGTASKNSSVLEVRLPAIRSTLNCTLYQGNDALKPSLTWGSVQFFPDNPLVLNGPGYFVLSVQPNTVFGSTVVESSAFDLTYYWGSISEHQIDHVAALGCAEKIEQVEVETTFVFPGFNVDSSHPPIPDEATRKPFSNADLESLYAFLPNITSANNFDTFFAALVYGKDGIPASDLTSTEQDVKVSNAIQSLHKIIRAQQYNEVLRSPALVEGEVLVLNGTITNPSRLRLVQNAISTRVLEALLGTILVCAIGASLLIDTRTVLPKNPCSIAAVASLLADSEIRDQKNGIIPPGAEWMSNKELEKRGVFKGYKFRMGWFGTGQIKSEEYCPLKDGRPPGIRFAIDIVGAGDARRADKSSSAEEQKPLFTEDVVSSRQS
jgi:hypothetical protein